MVCKGAAECDEALGLDFFRDFLDCGMEAVIEAETPDGRQSTQGGERRNTVAGGGGELGLWVVELTLIAWALA